MDTVQLINQAITICGGTQSALAEKASISQGLVSAFLKGRKSPGWDACQKIERATGGQITRYDLRPDIFGDAA